MKLIKKIYTVLVLLFNVLIRHRNYTLKFVAETNEMGKLWYYDFKHWGFDKHNLLMVAGADDMCETYSQGKDRVTVKIVASKKDLGYGCYYDHYIMEEPPKRFGFLERIIFGRDYKEVVEKTSKPKIFWICPVTLFVLGRYPKHIYIKR